MYFSLLQYPDLWSRNDKCLSAAFLTAKSCGMPPQPLRAEYNYTGVKYGDTATYSCQSGYDLEGNQTLTCDSTCEWTVTPCCISE